MKKYQEKLNIVDENDNIIGEDTRENIHRKGLLHREVHVWIYNKNLDILFQKRAKDKDTFPDLLDASVGGHVDLGLSYEESAIKELNEETGIKAKKKDLIFLEKIRKKSYDPVTKTVNNTFKIAYAYKLKDNNKLELEKGQATSLEFWPIEKLLHLAKKEKIRFVPFDWSKYPLPIFKQIKGLNKK